MWNGGRRCYSWGWLYHFISDSPIAQLQRDSSLINVPSEGRQCISAAGGVTKYITLSVSVWHMHIMRVYHRMCTSLCVFVPPCMRVTDQKGGGPKKKKNPENNKLDPLCGATLYDVLHNSKWKIPPMAPQSSWTVKGRHIKLGDKSGEGVMSHRMEGRLVPVNLLGWPDTSANTGSLCGIALWKAPPPLFSPTPCFSLNIFTFPDSENTVNSPCHIEGVGEMCALYVWCGYSSGLRQPNRARQPMWTGTKKKNNACWWEGGGRGAERLGWGLKVRWPPL